MARSKLKKKKKLEQQQSTAIETEESTSTKVPIDNLPKKFLWMHVKSGTTIRNILGYALKEFPSYDSIVWTGVGHAVAKTISCAEIFKRKHEGLHQVTKLCYVRPDKSKEDAAIEPPRIPEVHILLTKNIKDTTELGYQAPGDYGKFPKNDNTTESKTNATAEIFLQGTSDMPCKQFSTMKRKKPSMNKTKKNMEPSFKKSKVS